MILGAGVTFHHQSHIPVLHRPRASSKQPGPGAGEGKRPPSHKNNKNNNNNNNNNINTTRTAYSVLAVKNWIALACQ